MEVFSDLENVFQERYESLPGALKKNSRQQGFKYFLRQGLPSKKIESWKYTSLSGLKVENLIPSFQKATTKTLDKELYRFVNKNFCQIFVAGDEIFMRVSDKKYFQGKLTISRNNRKVISALGNARLQTKKIRQESLEGLNSAFAKPIYIQIQENAEFEKPVQIIFYSQSAGASYHRLNVFVGDGAKINFIESHYSSDKKHFTNSVSEVYLSSFAQFSCVREQNESKIATHFGCSRFYLQKKSRLESLVYSTGSKVSRHNLDVHCLGPMAEAYLNGLTLGGGDQHLDNSTWIDHVVGQCTTTQLYKSLLNGKSKAVFRGQVEIRPGSQKAVSEQLNKNLLLSKEAEADSIPQLNIFADDVKATHGSTIGQMSEEEIFYLLSRAISREKALELVSLGFVKDLIDRVSDKKIRYWLDKQLENGYREIGS